MSLGQDYQAFKSSLSMSRSEDVLTLRLGGEDHDGNTPFNVMEDLLMALDQVDADPSIRVLVLSFADGGYDFGTDVLDLSNLLPDEAERFSNLATGVYQRISNLEIPTLSAIRGDCFGIGFEISVQCDLRVACTGSRFGLTGMNFGLTPNGQAIRSLRSLVGESHARMMGLTGAMISADRGFVMGFVTNVLEGADFESGVNVLTNHLPACHASRFQKPKRSSRAWRRMIAQRLQRPVPEPWRAALTRIRKPPRRSCSSSIREMRPSTRAQSALSVSNP